MATVVSLSESDVAAVRQDLAAGKQTTVWFNPTAVGVPVGGSAKVVAVGEVVEGEFIEVRPTGSRDTMFCSPNELTRARPPRKRGARAAASEPVVAAKPARGSAATKSTPVATDPAPTGTSGGSTAEGDGSAEPVARKITRRRPMPAEVAITLVASGEGDWTVEVTVGKKRVVRSLPVRPTEVAKAARALPAPVTEAIEASMAAARKLQAERVEQLRAELDAAQQALRELNG